MYYDPSSWRQNRLENYRQKLNLSRKKALQRLMLFTDIERLIREFDGVVDKQFWSSNEPGISHKERMKRKKEMHKHTEPPAAQQLSLFNHYKI